MANNELLKLTAHQVKEKKFDKAILSVGSCEAHGQHLAEGTDTLVSYMLSCKIAEKVDGLLVLPPITVGYSAHYDTFPFTLTLRYDTCTQVIYDIAESVIRNGINHIFILNGHDGNIAPIEIASRKLKEQYPDVKIACLPQWWVTAGELLPPDTFEVWNGLGHAGEGESSIAYYLYPQWNEPDQAKGFVPDRGSRGRLRKGDQRAGRVRMGLSHVGDPLKGGVKSGEGPAWQQAGPSLFDFGLQLYFIHVCFFTLRRIRREGW